jgi:hypothetical protein
MKKDDEQSQPSSPFLVSQEESLLLLADGHQTTPRSCQLMMVLIAGGMGQQLTLAAGRKLPMLLKLFAAGRKQPMLIAAGRKQPMLIAAGRRIFAAGRRIFAAGSGRQRSVSASASELLKHHLEDQDLPLGMLVVVLRLRLCQRMMVQGQGQGLVMQRSQCTLSMLAHLLQCEERSLVGGGFVCTVMMMFALVCSLNHLLNVICYMYSRC